MQSFCGTLHGLWSAIHSNQGFWAILGVGVGFLLAEGSRVLRSWVERRRLRSCLREELRANLGLIEAKKNKISNMLAALEKRCVPSGDGVPAFSTIYDNNMPVLTRALTSDERHAAHMIYERLKAHDRLLFSFQDDITCCIRDKVMSDPRAAYMSRLKEVSEKYDILHAMVQSYLLGKPEEVVRGGWQSRASEAGQ